MNSVSYSDQDPMPQLWQLQKLCLSVLSDPSESTADNRLAHAWHLALEAESIDGTPASHLVQVGSIAEEVARQIGLSRVDQKLLFLSAMVHDIGKSVVPPKVLQKPSGLDDCERHLMQEHCNHGSLILKRLLEEEFARSGTQSSEYEVLRMAETIARTHHERWDGHGYPRRLKWEQIPLEGRIVCIADVYDALTTHRPYRAALDDNQALEVMMLEQGRQFDQEVFDAFLDCFGRVRVIRSSIYHRGMS